MFWIIICNIQSGGTGISLHDTNGNHPRISLISPTWSAQDLLQVLGRIHRAMAKTNSIQKIIFCKGTFDENIGYILKNKINNILMLNNGNSNKSSFGMSTKSKSTLCKSSKSSITNIIQNSYEKKKIEEKAKIDKIVDIEVIYNELLILYNNKEKINQILIENNNLSDIKQNGLNLTYTGYDYANSK